MAAKARDNQDASDEVVVAREHVIEDANTLKHLLGNTYMRACAYVCCRSGMAHPNFYLRDMFVVAREHAIEDANTLKHVHGLVNCRETW